MLKDVLAVEITAMNSYEEEIATFTNFVIKEKLELIKNDEIEHIRMLRELIEMLRS